MSAAVPAVGTASHTREGRPVLLDCAPSAAPPCGETAAESGLWRPTANQERTGVPVFYVTADKCRGCGACIDTCTFGAITMTESVARIDVRSCTECGRCLEVCPHEAITIAEAAPVVRVAAPSPVVAVRASSVLLRVVSALAPRLLEAGFWLLDNWLERRLSQPQAQQVSLPQAPPQRLARSCEVGYGRRERRRRGLF